MSGGLLPTKSSIPCCALKARNRRALRQRPRITLLALLPPYESKNGAREWFIGPVVTWLHSQDDRIAAVNQTGALATYCWPESQRMWACAPGALWLGMDWDVAHSAGASSSVRRHISFGVTRSVSASLPMKGGTMNTRKLALLFLLASAFVAGIAGADQAHRKCASKA